MIDISRIRAVFVDFRKDEKGSASIELVFMVPALAFILFMTVTFFGAFRAETHATRATIVLTDMFSRETESITPNFLEGADGLMKTLINSDDDPDFRVTSYTYDEDDDKYIVAWSKDNGAFGVLDDASLNAVSNRLPDMADGQHALLIQTSVRYEPLLDVGIGSRRFENFHVAALRFVPQLCFQESLTADPLVAEC